MRKKVTIWESWNHKEKKWQHNHIEDGWVDGDIPGPKKAWKGQKWLKRLGWIVDVDGWPTVEVKE